MKHRKIFLTLVGVVGVLLGLSSDAWAPGDGGVPPCLVDSPSGTAMNGTAAVTVTNQVGNTGNVGATLRLQWQGNEKFFRVHLPGALILTAEQLLCDILTAGPVDHDGRTIFAAFGISTSRQLKITNRSISGSGFDAIPLGDASSGLADITLYVQ